MWIAKMAGNVDHISKIKKRSLCAVCLDTYTDPKTFPCFHSYCSGCLSQLQQKRRNGKVGYECSVCRQFAFEKDVRYNFLVNGLTGIIKNQDSQEVVCLHCSKKTNPAWKCFDCKVFFCENCQAGHLKLPICHNHKIQPLKAEASASSQLVLNELVFCEKHPQEIVKLHCTTCESPICLQCKVLEHETHKAETIEARVLTVRTKLQKFKEQFGKAIGKKSHEIYQLNLTETRVKKDYADVRRRIHESRGKRILEIKDETEKLLRQVAAKETQQKHKLSIFKQAKETDLEKTKAQQEHVSMMMEMAQGASLVKAYHSSSQLSSSMVDEVVHVTAEMSQEEQQWEKPIFPNKVTVVQAQLPTITYQKEHIIKAAVIDESPKKITDSANEITDSARDIKGPCKEITNSAVADLPDVSHRCSGMPSAFTPNSLQISTEWLGSNKRQSFAIPCAINPKKFEVIGSDVYIVHTPTSKIIVLNIEGGHVENITKFMLPTSIAYLGGQMIAVSTQFRLELYDTSKDLISTISEGKFEDISYEDGHIVALASSANTVVIFKQQSNNHYIMTRKFDLTKGSISRILLKSRKVYLHFPDTHQVTVYSMDGDKETEISTKIKGLYTPNKTAKLCMVDERQSMIFTDCYSGTVEIHISQDLGRCITLMNFPSANDVKISNKKVLVLAGTKVISVNIE